VTWSFSEFGFGGLSEFQCPWDKGVGERFKGYFAVENAVIFQPFADEGAETRETSMRNPAKTR